MKKEPSACPGISARSGPIWVRWIVPDKEADGHGFHDVYTQPETVVAYKKTGKFPDGAVLIKEISGVETDTLTTGKASWAGKPKVWFVLVKDAKGRFADNPNWGNGWGWALFKAEDPTKSASTGFRKDCLRCHTPAKETDWVYVKGYPALR
jgi:cytochrome c